MARSSTTAPARPVGKSTRGGSARARAPRDRGAAREPSRRAGGAAPGPPAPSQAVLLHLAGQGVAVDAQHLRRRPDLTVGARQHPGDVAGFDFCPPPVCAPRPGREGGPPPPAPLPRVPPPPR